jgi:hypothetical protein
MGNLMADAALNKRFDRGAGSEFLMVPPLPPPAPRQLQR